MKPTLMLLVGAPLEGEEAAFLRTLCADLADVPALVLANFRVEGRQLDFLVVTAARAAIVELKNFSLPVFGGENGDWHFQNAAGRRLAYDGGNPYEQALQQKYALSDAMKRYQQRNPTVPPPEKKAFYADFLAFVCIYPEIHAESKVINGDFRVRVGSYAMVLAELRGEPESTRQPNWSSEHWRQFGEAELGLKPVTLDEATDPRVGAASMLLNAYRAAVEASLRVGLGPLADASDSVDYGRRLIECSLEPRNLLFIGPSGSAKTFHLHHLALALCAAGEVPAFVDAKRYRGGDFWNVLRQGVAPYFAGDPKALLEAVRLCGLRPALLLDALNECDALYLPDLLRGVQAFVTHFRGRVVLTSQQEPELPGDLGAVIKRLRLPDAETKRIIYSYHAAVPPTPALDVFCQGFTNAYDLTIAGRLHTASGDPESRCDLYDRYVRASLGTHQAIASGFLRRMAGQMAEKVSMVCTRDEFERGAEQFISENKASLSILDELHRSRLIRLGHDFVTFEHELLFDYFKAEELRRRVASFDELTRELERPRYRDLLEFVLPRLTESSEAAQLLSTSRDVALLTRVSEGKCGVLAMSVLQGQCETLIDAALQDLPNISITIQTIKNDEGKRSLAGVAITGNRAWSAYDATLCDVIARNQTNAVLRDRFLDLLDLTAWTLRNAAQAAGERDRIKAARVWEETVRLYGGVLQHGNLRLPCTAILSSLRSALMYPRHYPDGLPIRRQLLQRIDSDNANHLALLALLQDHHRHTINADDIATNLALFRKGWASEIYMLRGDALELLRSMNHAIRETCPEELPRIREMLASLETRNILENTLYLETLAAYDGLEQEITAEAALDEMRALIAPNIATDSRVLEIAKLTSVTPEQFLAERAQGTLSRIFEDVFQGAYFEGYFSLSDEEKHQILCLAASAGTGYLTDWVLGELLQHDGATALPVYQRCAGGIDPTHPFHQEAVSCFAMGVEGSARWSDTPPAWLQPDSPAQRAWQLMGEILFWRARGPRNVESDRRIEELWRRLDGPVLLGAADVLFQLNRSGWRLKEGGVPAANLAKEFPGAVRRIAEVCVRQRESLPSIFPTYPGSDRELIRFLISTLADVPDRSSIAILQELADDNDFGADAIRAIAVIQKSMLNRDTATELA